MNLSIFKREINRNVLTDNNLENDEVYEVKNLYVTTLGRVINDSILFESFSLNKEKNDPIIVKRINYNKKVLDILNNIEYFHFYSIKSLKKYVGCYMASELKPLSMILEDKTKTFITKREILKFLDLLDKYIDHHYKDYDIYDEEFIRKITFKKIR